jgi:hypothetical protein
MKLLIIFTLTLVPELFARDFKRKIITDPAISRRCEQLIQEREDKIQHKQKIMELISRNRLLFFETPKHRLSVLEQLRLNYEKLRRELRLSLIKINRQEEHLVRRGCPGVKL